MTDWCRGVCMWGWGGCSIKKKKNFISDLLSHENTYSMRLKHLYPCYLSYILESRCNLSVCMEIIAVIILPVFHPSLTLLSQNVTLLRLLIKATQSYVWELSCFLSVDIWHHSCLLPSSVSDCIQPLLLQRLHTYCSERRCRRRQRRGLHWEFPGKAGSDCMTTCPNGNKTACCFAFWYHKIGIWYCDVITVKHYIWFGIPNSHQRWQSSTVSHLLFKRNVSTIHPRSLV